MTRSRTRSTVPNASEENTQAEYDLTAHAPKNKEQVTMRPRMQFTKSSGVSERPQAGGAMQPRGETQTISDLRGRMRPANRPSDLPLAVIDGYGFILPFSQSHPMDRVILANIPDITFIWTQEDLETVRTYNEKRIREGRFDETLQGAKMLLPPEPEIHGFRNGREVVAAMVDETMLDSALIAQQFQAYQ